MTGARSCTGFKPKPPVITYRASRSPRDGVYSAHGGQGGRVNAYTLGGQLRWSATFDGDAQAVTVLGDIVYAGGHFDRACNTARTGAQGSCVDGADDRVKLAALSVADGHLLDWTADANGVEGVLALASSPELGRSRWAVPSPWWTAAPRSASPSSAETFLPAARGRISLGEDAAPCL